jgi:hypothetical protein
MNEIIDIISFLSKECDYISTYRLANIIGTDNIKIMIKEEFIERIADENIDVCYFKTKKLKRHNKLNELLPIL